MSLVDLIILLLIAGIVAFLIRRAPFIDAEYKAYALWALLALVCLYLILALAGRTPCFTCPLVLRR